MLLLKCSEAAENDTVMCFVLFTLYLLNCPLFSGQ